mgnify:CR=1 FL=1
MSEETEKTAVVERNHRKVLQGYVVSDKMDRRLSCRLKIALSTACTAR